MTTLRIPRATTSTAGRRSRMRVRERLEMAGTYAVLAVFLLIGLFPFFWMLRTAFTPKNHSP